MTTTLSPTTRFLPLWTYRGRSTNHGRMHLARAKTTKKPVTTSWCGHRFFTSDVVNTKTYITGEEAVLLLQSDVTPPTCAHCLDRVGATGWYE